MPIVLYFYTIRQEAEWLHTNSERREEEKISYLI
jgi:hypothetical protein